MKILSILIILLLTGCSTLISDVKNDPTFSGPIGKNVVINIISIDNELINDTIEGKILKQEAIDWLSKRNYSVITKTSKADLVIWLKLSQKTKDYYVPAQTYSMPVYGTNNSTTTVVKGAYGQKLGSIETEQDNFGPNSWKTYYREGYNTSVTSQILFLDIQSQIYGKMPMIVSSGKIYPTDYDQEFFSSSMKMNRAISTLLAESILCDKDSQVTCKLGIPEQRSPATAKIEINEDKLQDKACWPRLGLLFDEKIKLENGVRVKDIEPESNANKSGVKIGDIIYSIGGQDQPSKTPIKLSIDKPVSIVLSRDSKELRIEMLPKMICLNK